MVTQWQCWLMSSRVSVVCKIWRVCRDLISDAFTRGTTLGQLISSTPFSTTISFSYLPYCITPFASPVIVLALVTGYSWGSSGFRLWLQLTSCAYLLTLSKYFKWGQTFRLWMKSEAS